MMGEERTPLVSVVVPTFNRPDYLRIALESALQQSLQDMEIIVQDNASAKDPSSVVASFEDPRIAYYRNDAPVSQTANVVSACAKARGKYLAILGDDDIWQPDFLASLVEPLEADESVVVAFCDHDIINSAGHRDDGLSDTFARRWGRKALSGGRHQPFDDIALVHRSICVFSAAVLRRAEFPWGAIPVHTAFGLDIYLGYLAARTGKACFYVPRRLSQYRVHPGALGSSLKLVDQKIINARDAMYYWDEFLRDRSLGRYQRYFKMKLALNALLIVVNLVRRGDWLVAMKELRGFVSAGVLSPRALLSHVNYALRLRRIKA